jgi:hypothetical protein
MNRGGYILAVEGGVPTAFGGNTCWAWSLDGVDVTFLDAVRSMAAQASQVLCIGTCASFGGIPHLLQPNGVQSVKPSAATGEHPTARRTGLDDLDRTNLLGERWARSILWQAGQAFKRKVHKSVLAARWRRRRSTGG